MTKIIILTLLLTLTLISEELQIKAKVFNADQKKGISVFEGNVNILKGTDELNASKVTIYTNKENKPIKYIAEGDASFRIKTQDNAVYSGVAQKVIYIPETKEYSFFKNVHLKQINEKKEIIGEEVVLKTVDGKAYARGADKEPVIMIFNIEEKKKK